MDRNVLKSKIESRKRFWAKGADALFTNPHFKFMATLLVGAILFLLLSITTKDSDPFLSSLFANIFCGIITGIILSIGDMMRDVYRKNLDEELAIYNEIKNYIFKYFEMWSQYRKDKTKLQDEDFSYEIINCAESAYSYSRRYLVSKKLSEKDIEFIDQNCNRCTNMRNDYLNEAKSTDDLVQFLDDQRKKLDELRSMVVKIETKSKNRKEFSEETGL